MAALAQSSSYQMLRRFVPRFPCYPLLHSATLSQAKRSLPFPSAASLSFTLRSPVRLAASPRAFSDGGVLFETAAIELGRESDAIDAAPDTEGLKSSDIGRIRTPPSRPPSLSVKEKKELASFAHSLGRKLKSQQVGKSGVTDTVVMALSETLEANELLKLKIHGTCPGEFDDVVNQLEQSTGSIVVGQIGRTVILYRPSLTKLKAEEKRKHTQKAHFERQPTQKQSPQSPQSKKPVPVSGKEPKQHGRGRRGSSRF